MLLPIFLGRDMDAKAKTKNLTKEKITVEDVNRLLDLGRLLFSVLTPEEIETLQEMFNKHPSSKEIGNAGDS
jgi:hypothetical protein